jgi:aspartyl aminopeptidase
VESTSAQHSLDDESGVRMVALFDHEEVGSDSAQGAGSPAMLDALTRITGSFNHSNSKVQSNFLHLALNLLQLATGFGLSHTLFYDIILFLLIC